MKIGICRLTLHSHTEPVMQVKWSGENWQRGGLIYTAGWDRVIKVWDSKDGQLLKNLKLMSSELSVKKVISDHMFGVSNDEVCTFIFVCKHLGHYETVVSINVLPILGLPSWAAKCIPSGSQMSDRCLRNVSKKALRRDMMI